MKDLEIFNQLKSSIQVFVGPIKDLKVRDISENAAALGALKTVKEFSKQIEVKRTELVAPHNNQVKTINSYAKELSAPLDDAERLIKTEMANFAKAEQVKREAEARKIEAERQAAQREVEKQRAEAEKAKLEEQKALEKFGVEVTEKELAAAKEVVDLDAQKRQAEAEKEAALKLKALENSRPKNTRQVWKFEIENPDIIPDEYFSIDEQEIGRDVRVGVREIPGVRIYAETIVVA